jgi:hypothetical protein
VAVFSVALAQNKEETKSHYGMAFSLEDSASLNSESRIGSVPGEGSQSTPESTSESPVTTTFLPSTEETPVTVTVLPEDNDKKLDESDQNNDQNPTFVIASNDEEEDNKSSENGDEKTNPRLVFIERLMGMHFSAPLNGQQPDKEREENSALENGPQLPFKNPFDKVNGKWASRMRKFSIPLMQQQQSQPEPPNPLLRYAAAAMMTRLLAAAARAHENGPMMGKDKDDDSDDETVPVLLATMRSNEPEREQFGRPMPPMYGRPMPRPAMMRPPMRPPIKYIQPQARMASSNVPQRVFATHMMPQRSPLMQRPLPPYQPVLVMLAHVPMPVQMAESRMGVSHVAPNPYYGSQQHSMPIYPQVPYALPMGFHPMQRPIMPMEAQTPVHVPVHIPVASYNRPVYHAPYQTGPYQRQSVPSRPIIEIPIEIPIPVHVPIPVQHHNDVDHDTSASDAEQVAIVYFDPEGNDGPNDHEVSDHSEPQTSESNENVYRVGSGQKGYPFLSRPLPDTQSATKMKLWREYVGAKQASNPGVRYIPVAVANDDSQSQAGHYSQLNAEHSEMAESQSHPAFVILADDNIDAQQEHQ